MFSLHGHPIDWPLHGRIVRLRQTCPKPPPDSLELGAKNAFYRFLDIFPHHASMALPLSQSTGSHEYGQGSHFSITQCDSRTPSSEHAVIRV
jgi:hypothetical protein